MTPRLLAILDERTCERRGINPDHALAAALALSGVHVRLRPARDGLPTWQHDRLVALGDPRHTLRILVTADAALCVDHRCAGVHLRSDDPPARLLREHLPSHALLGRSVHHGHPILAGNLSDDDRALDFVLVSPVHPPRSKPDDTRPLLPTAGFAIVPRPVVALGGVTAATAPDLLRDGAAGVAALTPFCSDDPTDALALWRAIAPHPSAPS